MLDFFFAAATTSEHSPAKAFLDASTSEDERLLLLGKLCAGGRVVPAAREVPRHGRPTSAWAATHHDVIRMKKVAAEYEACTPTTIQPVLADDQITIDTTLALASQVAKKRNARFKTNTRLVKVEDTDMGDKVLVSALAEIRAPISLIASYIMRRSRGD